MCCAVLCCAVLCCAVLCCGSWRLSLAGALESSSEQSLPALDLASSRCGAIISCDLARGGTAKHLCFSALAAVVLSGRRHNSRRRRDIVCCPLCRQKALGRVAPPGEKGDVSSGSTGSEAAAAGDDVEAGGAAGAPAALPPPQGLEPAVAAGVGGEAAATGTAGEAAAGGAAGTGGSAAPGTGPQPP